MIDHITIPRFCAVTGYTDDAVRAKIANGVWVEGIVWCKAPDGRVLISQQGYEAWVAGRVSELLEAKRSRSTSAGKAKGAANVYAFDRLPQT